MSTHKHISERLHAKAPDIESVFQQSGFDNLSYHEIQQIDEGLSAAKRWKLLTDIHLHPEAVSPETQNIPKGQTEDKSSKAGVSWPPACKIPPLFEHSQPDNIAETNQSPETDSLNAPVTRKNTHVLHELVSSQSGETMNNNIDPKHSTEGSLQACFARLQPEELNSEISTPQEPENLGHASLLQAVFIRLENKQSLPSTESNQALVPNGLSETNDTDHTVDLEPSLWPIVKAV